MKITLYSIGKQHDVAIKNGIDDFSQRITRYFKCDWIIVASPKNAAKMTVDEQRKKEAENLLQWLQKDDCLIVLDEKGKSFDSVSLANLIQTKANESTRHIIFFIGGAFGIDHTVRQRADYIWSLSPLTFPHQLVRLILAEQLYRACTILKNEKYHHE